MCNPQYQNYIPCVCECVCVFDSGIKKYTEYKINGSLEEIS